MASTIATSIMAFAFWIVVARWFPAEVVGRASALIASMTLIASVAQLNLVNIFARFLPTAGGKTARWVTGGFSAVAVTAGLLGTAFLVLRLDGGLGGAGLGFAVLFVVSATLAAVSSVADGVITSLGRAHWVPLKNVGTHAAKLGLAVILGIGGLTASYRSLFLTWIVPIAISVTLVVVAALRLARRRRGTPQTALVRRRQVASFVGAEYVNGILGNVVIYVPPVLVAHVLGAEHSAYFYVPWTMGVGATALLLNIVTSFVVAASSNPTQAPQALRRAIRLGAIISVPGALVLALGGKQLLSLVGPGYAHGAGVLSLVGASLPFTAVLLLYSAFCVMRKRVWPLAAVQTGAVLVLMGISWWGLPLWGASAPGLAYLVAQAGFALVVLPRVIRSYRETVQRRADWVRVSAQPALAELPA
jgi:O-antigen/teichoic acid export membrane protein